MRAVETIIMQTAWQTKDVAHVFLDERRRAVPYAEDQIALMLRLIARFRPAPRMLLDLGAGDGILTRAVLSTYANSQAILVDHSEPMIERAWEAMADYEERSVIMQADLATSLDAIVGDVRPDVVISGYAIHHLTDDRKRELYAEIYEKLQLGGVFINIEHVKSGSKTLETIWDETLIEQIARTSQITWEDAAAAYYSRADQYDNILAPVETQTQWLREIGFRDVDCYFKYFELAVFGGTKSVE